MTPPSSRFLWLRTMAAIVAAGAFAPGLHGEGDPAAHWAFQAPASASVPEGAHPVDHFVHTRLRREALQPSPSAPKHTLIRRLSLDLRGLPPTHEEVARFVADDRPDAWTRLVEDFLASPHFGERLAQNWLDLARYADTSGYAADRTRAIWVYRDWVVDSINRNQPFDQFTIEQLAGDLVSDATTAQRIATGFHRNAQQAKGNNPRKEEFRVKTIVDRLETTGRTWLGLTLECAECHDHVHDPISQKEYYQLFAIFNNIPHLGSGYKTHGPRMPYRPPVDAGKRAELEREIAEVRSSLPPARSPHDESLQGTWNGSFVAENTERFSLTGDLSITAMIRTKAAIADIVSKNDWRNKERSYVFGIGGEGESNAPPGHLFAWISARRDPWAGAEIYGSTPVNDGRDHHVALVFEAGRSLKLFVDGIEDTKARIVGTIPPAIAQCDRHFTVGAGYDDAGKPESFQFKGELRDVRLYAAALSDPGQLGEAGARLADLHGRLAALQGNELQVPVMEELASPRTTHIHLRGNFKNRGERVHPGVPAFLPPMAGDSTPTRLDFARWLVQPNHPLTARVAVNRLWQHFFGTGLVATPADFGTYGARPTHPELLDWLAVEFVRRGWDRKALVRLLVTSETYRQSSAFPPRLQERDPSNRLLARMSRHRFPAEQIRDQALAVSGLLVPTLGGPPVFPPQPAGLYEERGQNEAANSNFTWVDSTGESRHRKSLYTYWKRMMLHPTLATFDAPSRQVCTARRSITNTPRQALVTLNDPIFHECAQALAKRIAEHAPDDRERVRFAFRTCLARNPQLNEEQQFLAFLKAGDDPQTAWTSLATVLLNLDEFLTRE